MGSQLVVSEGSVLYAGLDVGDEDCICNRGGEKVSANGRDELLGTDEPRVRPLGALCPKNHIQAEDGGDGMPSPLSDILMY